MSQYRSDSRGFVDLLRTKKRNFAKRTTLMVLHFWVLKITALLLLVAEKLFYVSCNPAVLPRDAFGSPALPAELTYGSTHAPISFECAKIETLQVHQSDDPLTSFPALPYSTHVL